METIVSFLMNISHSNYEMLAARLLFSILFLNISSFDSENALQNGK